MWWHSSGAIFRRAPHRLSQRLLVISPLVLGATGAVTLAAAPFGGDEADTGQAAVQSSDAGAVEEEEEKLVALPTLPSSVEAERIVCTWLFGCRAGSWFTLVSTEEPLQLRIENNTRKRVEIFSMQWLMLAEQTQHTADSKLDGLGIEALDAVHHPLPLGPGDPSVPDPPASDDSQVERRFRPGQYDGLLRVRVGDGTVAADTIMTVATTVKVRSAPGWPIFWLLIGIILGRWVVKSGKGKEELTEAKASKRWTLAGIRRPAETERPTKGQGFGTALSGVVWSNDNMPEFWVRAIGAFVLWVALVLEGLQTLYLSNQVFGVGGASDLAGLFLWGFSSDVVGRTLGNFRWPPT